MKSDGIDLSLRWSRVSLNASKPSSNGMFVYMLFKSIEIGFAVSGKVPHSFSSSSMRNMWGVSSMNEPKFLTASLAILSQNHEILSVVLP